MERSIGKVPAGIVSRAQNEKLNPKEGIKGNI